MRWLPRLAHVVCILALAVGISVLTLPPEASAQRVYDTSGRQAAACDLDDPLECANDGLRASAGGTGGKDRAGSKDQGGKQDGKGNGGGGGLGDTTGQIDPGGESSGPQGTANPLQIRNPLCKEMKGEVRRNCKYGQGPETPYPTINYGLDVYADDSGSGTDAIVGNFQRMLATIANAIWMLLLFLVKLVLTLLGWAFELSPFSNDRATSRVDSGLERFYDSFSAPWLTFGIVMLGAWALWRGVLRREVSQTIGGVVLSMALMILALWIIHAPAQTVGRISNIVNKATLGVISAPQGGSVTNPTPTYGEATQKVWRIMTTTGFTALQFSDPKWALEGPDPDLKDYMWDDTERYCSDAAFGSVSQGPDGADGIPAADEDPAVNRRCLAYRAALGEPRNNVELLLAASPGSEARSDEMWNEFDGHIAQAKMAMQGGGGVWLRLPLALLIGAGLLGGVCLLAWLTIRIFVQTAVAFVLVLSAPLALFFPAFGEKGRAAFNFWGGTLLGALLAKLVYAALLAIVLFATTVIYGLIGGDRGISVMMGFLCCAGLWWAVFLKREEIVGWVSLSERGEGGSAALNAAGLYAGYRLGRDLIGKATGGDERDEGRGQGRGPFGVLGSGGREEGAARTENRASRQLDDSAKERLDTTYQQGQAMLQAQQATRAAAAEHTAQARDARERAAALATRAGAESDPTRAAQMASEATRLEQVAENWERRAERAQHEVEARSSEEQRARAFMEHADANEARSGARWSRRDLDDSREVLRHKLDRPVESGAHAHYVGMDPKHYESLQGPEREAAHRRVGERIKEDKRAFGVIPDKPGGAPAPAHKRVAYRAGEARGKAKGAADALRGRTGPGGPAGPAGEGAGPNDPSGAHEASRVRRPRRGPATRRGISR